MEKSYLEANLDASKKQSALTTGTREEFETPVKVGSTLDFSLESYLKSVISSKASPK